MCCHRKGYALAARRAIQRKTNVVAKFIAAAVVSCVLAGFIGFNFASADNTNAPLAGEFGIGSTSVSLQLEQGASSSLSSAGVAEASVLGTAMARDISQNVADIKAEEEAARIAAEEAARLEAEERVAAAEAARIDQLAASLTEIDWSVGKDAFITEWTGRIDSYLAGSPLSGYGVVFAQAAWDYGIDPRFSPAISNTESTKGANCFMPYNAWGWMGTESWSSWDQSIYAHAKGLSAGYGYSITIAGAQKYCPPTYLDWYEKTLSQMQMI